MLRLTVLLCAALFVTLLIAGEDKGQMRPGLARAIAEGEEIVVLQRRWSPVETLPEAEPAVAVIAEPAAPAEAEVIAVAAAPVVEEPTPAPAVEKVTPAPVFTLSSLPEVTMEASPEASEPVAAVSGDVWYVTANTVNVREGPSTGTSVVDKLKRGEAVTVAFEEGSEWARVTIEGDGLEGYVALRFLSPDAP